MKAVVAAFNQEKALVGAFSVITNLRMELFEALVSSELCCTKEKWIISQIKQRLQPRGADERAAQGEIYYKCGEGEIK